MKKKKLKKKSQNIFNVVEKFSNSNKMAKSPIRGWVSIEWVGKYHNQTPGVNGQTGIVVHKDQLICDETEKIFKISKNQVSDLDFVMKYFRNFAIEGLVYEHPKTHRLFKFRSNMLPGEKGLHDKVCK